MISEAEQVKEFLRENRGRLHHRENQELEFKEQFNFSGLAEYLRDFAAFANNRGGYLIFGVTDSPRKAIGLSDSATDQFDKIDPQQITGNILKIFSSEIIWKHDIIKYKSKNYGYFRVFEHTSKPVITKKDEGRDQELRNGDIYYRYGGRTQRIQSAELENIIAKRIEETNRHWTDLMSKIGRIGPTNAAILDTESGVIEKGAHSPLMIDSDLAKSLTFIKEGAFSEKAGAKTLKLVGDVVPIDKIEVIKKEKENLTKIYTLSAEELAKEVMDNCETAKKNQIWTAIRENKIKENKDYSAYNFRNKKHEDEYLRTGILPNGTPSIYKPTCVDYICKIIEEKDAQPVGI